MAKKLKPAARGPRITYRVGEPEEPLLVEDLNEVIIDAVEKFREVKDTNDGYSNLVRIIIANLDGDIYELELTVWDGGREAFQIATNPVEFKWDADGRAPLD